MGNFVKEDPWDYYKGAIVRTRDQRSICFVADDAIQHDINLLSCAPELYDMVLDLSYKLYGNEVSNPKLKNLLEKLEK